MSNLFVPPKGAPPPWYRDPGLPTFDSNRNNRIYAKGMQGMQTDFVWDNLVVPKGLKPLPSLLVGDLSPMLRHEFKGAQAKEEALLPGKSLALLARKRDSVAATMTAEMIDKLDQESAAIDALFGEELFSVDDLKLSMASVCAWRDVPPSLSLGRLMKYLSPENKTGLSPPTSWEVADAARALGLPSKLPLPKVVTSRGVPECDTWKECVTWNKQATAGLPHLCGGDKDPGVFEDAAALAEHFYVEFTDAYRKDPVSGIRQKYREFAERYPGLFTNIGKTKSENVSIPKAEAAEGRFYNATPLWARLLFSSVTQVFAEHCAPFGTEYEVSPQRREGNRVFPARTDITRNTQGLSFYNGGFTRYVNQFAWKINEAARDARLKINQSWKHVACTSSNCGDDTDFAAYVYPLKKWLRLAFDCSSFDLTQHHTVLRPLLEWLRNVLSTSDPVIGQLWFEMYSWRPTWIMGCMRVLMKCGGPSGQQLQDKVNAILMRVFLTRFERELELKGGGDYSKEALEKIAAKIADKLGLVLKLEQYALFDAEDFPLYELTYEVRPSLYLGYFGWSDVGFEKMTPLEQAELLIGHMARRTKVQIWPCFDLRRMIPALPFPNSRYEPDDKQFAEDRWVRCASLYYTCGVPPDCLSGAVAVLRRFLLQEGKRLREAGVKFDVDRRATFWETNLASAGELPESTFEDLPKHVGSLFARLGTPLEDIWDLEPPERPEVPERELRGPFLHVPQKLRVDRLPKPRPSVTRTGVTRQNFGRPPPVTPWAPPKEREKSGDVGLSARALRKEPERFAREYHESRFQVMEDDEYGGDLPRRARRGRS